LIIANCDFIKGIPEVTILCITVEKTTPQNYNTSISKYKLLLPEKKKRAPSFKSLSKLPYA
jgi:hypothetical protein